MNLLNGGERELELPKEAGAPERVGWSNDGTMVIVRTGQGLYRFDAPPAKPEAHPVPAADSTVAESSLAVLLGDPVFARVVLCKRTTDLCLTTRRGTPGILAQAARDPVRWGTDSVAFLVGDNLLQIRPLAKGRPRALNWSNVPARPRQLTFFEGGESGEAGKRGGWKTIRAVSHPLRNRIPRRFESQSHLLMIRRPLLGTHPLRRKGHQRQPHRGPQLRRTGAHQSVRLSARHNRLQCLPELARRAAAAVVEVALVPAAEQHANHGRVPFGRTHQAAAHAEQALAGRQGLVSVLSPDQLESPRLGLAIGGQE